MTLIFNYHVKNEFIFKSGAFDLLKHMKLSFIDLQLFYWTSDADWDASFTG